MKRFSKLMSLLLFAAVTQYSCINDADVVIADDTHSESNGNLALFFEIPNVATSRSAESSGVTTEGSKEEYAVKSLTVYLFDSTTKTLKDQQELKNINRTVTSGQNIQYTADKITVNPGTYNIFAIANGKAITGNISTQEAFLNAVDAVTYSAGKIPSVPENGFVMTNRGAANLNVEVKKPTDSDKVTSVSIGLERVVAKVELTQTQETFPLTDPSGKTYCTIKLNNFRMLNLATQFYTFRHTAVLNSFQEPDSYTDENFGDINDNNGYVIDPYFFKKTVENAGDFTNADGFFAQALVQLDINDGNWAGMAQANSWSHIYCLENCMFLDAQLNAYSTGVMFKANMDIAFEYAQLCEEEEVRNIYQIILHEWQLTKDIILMIEEQDELLAENPYLKESLDYRMPYFNVLNYIQLELIRRQRTGQLPADQDKLIHITINGVATVLRNSG